jgi:hypothetical protein
MYVNLSGISTLSDRGLEPLNDLPKLKRVNLSYVPTHPVLTHYSFCEKITDAGVKQLIGKHQLTQLNLYKCLRVSEQLVGFLTESVTSLQVDVYNAFVEPLD